MRKIKTTQTVMLDQLMVRIMDNEEWYKISAKGKIALSVTLCTTASVIFENIKSSSETDGL